MDGLWGRGSIFLKFIVRWGYTSLGQLVQNLKREPPIFDMLTSIIEYLFTYVKNYKSLVAVVWRPEMIIGIIKYLFTYVSLLCSCMPNVWLWERNNFHIVERFGTKWWLTRGPIPFLISTPRLGSGSWFSVFQLRWEQRPSRRPASFPSLCTSCTGPRRTRVGGCGYGGHLNK